MRTQYQVQNETKIRRNQKIIKNDNDQLIVKNYPKNKNKKLITPQQLQNCPFCKRNSWLDFNEGYYCKNCEFIINKQKHQIDKKVFRQDNYFSTRLPDADKRIREIWMNLVNTKCNTTEEMLDKLQQLNGKTKLKFYKIISNYYNEMKHENCQTQEDAFSRNAKGISRINHEVLSLMKFLQTKPQVRNMKINY